MCENRKMTEALQGSLMTTLEVNLAPEELPATLEDIAYTEQEITRSMNTDFREGINKDTLAKPALDFYFELQSNIRELILEKKELSNSLSRRLCEDLYDELCSGMNRISELQQADLRSPNLMENLQEHIEGLLASYYERAKGQYRCKPSSYLR